jgi:hypothetical protein
MALPLAEEKTIFEAQNPKFKRKIQKRETWRKQSPLEAIFALGILTKKRSKT